MMDNDSLPLYPKGYPNPTVVNSEPMYPPTVSQPRPASAAPALLTQPPPLLLGPENTITTCPFCNASIKTAVTYTTTTATHIAAAHCSVICCCCCLPYALDSAKNADHYCPNCKRYLGTYRR